MTAIFQVHWFATTTIFVLPSQWSKSFCCTRQKSFKRFRDKILRPHQPTNRNYCVSSSSIVSPRSSTAKPTSLLLKNWASLPKRPKITLSAFPHKTLSFIMRMTGTKNPKIRYIQKTTLMGCFFFLTQVVKNKYFLYLFRLKNFSFRFILFVNNCLSLLVLIISGK